VLLFKHANLTVAESTALRNAVAAVPVPAGSEGAQGEGARLTIARTGLLGPAVHSAQPEGARLTQHLDGQTALVTVPTLSPKYISGVLSAIDKVIKKAQKDPGNDKTKVVKQPAFTLVAGVLEGNRLFEADAIRDVSKLPELSTLHAQLVGLLESPGRQLVGVLSQAGGGALVRTLQGLEQGLKDKEAKAE
jgi:large subunit ribosomal protein L10